LATPSDPAISSIAGLPSVKGSIVKKSILCTGLVVFLAACAGPKVTRTQPLEESADAPYGNVMVVSLFQSFDMRRYFEKEIVKQLEAAGIDAVASTSMIDVKTPLNRDTVVEAVGKANSDAVLVTQLLDSQTTARFRDRSPESTYNIRPTYYYNVWSVEYTEYVEPKGLETKHALTMATQIFSTRSQEPVWTIETQSKLKRNIDGHFSGTSIADESKAIVGAMARDGLLAR
jgi:hypothetical protein